MKPELNQQNPDEMTYQGLKILRRYVDRLPSKYTQLDGPKGCWHWTGSVNSGGTPTYGIGNHPKVGDPEKKTYKTAGAHKFVFVYYHGDKYSHEIVKRSCGNLRCVNPAHMYVEVR